MNDKRKKVIALICKYLHEKKALERYIYNVCEYHNIDVSYMTARKRTIFVIDDCLNRLLNNNNNNLLVTYLGEFFINCSSCFEWARSIEGHRYWANLSNEWRYYLRKKNKEFKIKLK